jgi:hypothetical protein
MTSGRKSLAVWSVLHKLIRRALRAEAAHAPKRVFQEHENDKRSKIGGGLERSDIIK